MTRAGLWRMLAIDRTTDVAAIRRAYAQALRALDPDADPDAFARLRAARDNALAYARNAATADAPADPAEAPPPSAISPLVADTLAAPLLDGDPAVALSVALDPAPPIRSLTDARADAGDGIDLALPNAGIFVPVVDRTRGDVAILSHTATTPYDAAYTELLGLLQGDDEPEPAQLEALVRTLLDDPRMARLAFVEDAARWFADVLADTIPRSDPLLEPVARHFGWVQQAGAITLPDAAERVVERGRALAYVRTVEQPGHPFHRLWRELARPVDGTVRRGWFLGRKRMREYLASMRRSYPDAEDWLQPERVAAWEKGGVGGPGWSLWGIGLFVLVKLAIVLGGQSDRSTSQPVVVSGPTIVGDYRRDAELALLSFANGLTLERVGLENPMLEQAVEQRWEKARTAKVPVDTFVRDVNRYLRERFTGSVLRANYDAVVDLRRLDLAELDAARALGTDACARYLAGNLPLARVRSRWDEQKRRRAMAAILLADSLDTRPKMGATVSIPGAVMARLERETGLDRPALVAAFDRRGPAAAQCAARRALLSTALALPRATALPILRGM